MFKLLKHQLNGGVMRQSNNKSQAIRLKLVQLLLIAAFAGFLPIDNSNIFSKNAFAVEKRLYVGTVTGTGSSQDLARHDVNVLLVEKRRECTAAGGSLRAPFVYAIDFGAADGPDGYSAIGGFICASLTEHGIPWSTGMSETGNDENSLRVGFDNFYRGQAEACENEGGYPSYGYYGITRLGGLSEDEYEIVGVVHCDPEPPLVEWGTSNF